MEVDTKHLFLAHNFKLTFWSINKGGLQGYYTV